MRRIGYGAMALTGPGGWGEPPEPRAARDLLRRAIDLGVQLFDTADSYGPEVSEQLLAEALHPYPPEVVIATKGGSIREGPWQLHADGRPAHLRATCHGSLRRLRIDRIDLYQLHGFDSAVPLDESVGALAELRAEGKIRYVGLSNATIEQIESARKIVPIVSVQNEYNLANRGAQDDVIAYCERLLARSEVVVPIPGTLSGEHLEENIRAQTLELQADDLAALDAYRLSTFDARSLARRFVPPRLRRVAVSLLRLTHSSRLRH